MKAPLKKNLYLITSNKKKLEEFEAIFILKNSFKTQETSKFQLEKATLLWENKGI